MVQADEAPLRSRRHRDAHLAFRRRAQIASLADLPVASSLAERYFAIVKLSETGAERWPVESTAVIVSS